MILFSETLLDSIADGTRAHITCSSKQSIQKCLRAEFAGLTSHVFVDRERCLACLFARYALELAGIASGNFDFIALREQIATRVIQSNSVYVCMVVGPC